MLFFEREQELYISTVTSGFSTSNTVKIAALAGTSISYNLTDNSNYDYRVSDEPKRLAEKIIAGFTAPTLSFTTYAKYTSNSTVEKLLLYSLTGNEGIEGANEYTTKFTSVNKLPELYVYLKYGDLVYLLSKMVVSRAKYKFELNKVLEVEWDLVGLSLDRVSSVPSTFTNHTGNTNYIKCNFSTFNFSYDSTTGKLPLISGSIVFSNEVETVERITLATRGTEILDHYVTSRDTILNTIGYLKTGSSTRMSNYELFDSINSNIDFSTDNNIAATFNVGKVGEYQFQTIFEKAQIKLPQIKLQDVITSNIEVTAQTKTLINDDTTIKYIGV